MAAALCLLALTVPGSKAGDGVHLKSAGVRFGNTILSEINNIYSYEAYASWTLPWTWHLSENFFLETGLELSLGCLIGNGEEAIQGAVSPSLRLRRSDFPLYLQAGAGPGGLSRWVFDQTDLGGPFQITTHVQIGCDIGDRFGFGYRYHHISNARIYDSNPGLNVHLIFAEYRF